ncbi:nuclear transport factor 2 family protein [Pendulispora albinea]|uniref:Nuclear transport factor 2 family protein n=1 Tax=Pendulispora albinea TaxID=2741071 RepID=A0ABZ2LZZ5_9BACT
MYHFFVRRHLREVFARLNAGDYAFITRQFGPSAVHWFAGQHALSGERKSPARIKEWYERLANVFPGIRFDIRKLIVAGPPWNTHAAVEWVDEARDRNGKPLPNQGVFILRLRWGKAIEFRVYCDTARIEKNLGILSSQGVAAASAAPIAG